MRSFYFASVLFCIAGYLTVSQVNADIDNLCIGCICEAASGCNQTQGCIRDACGMFKITWPYWADAGKPIIALDDPASPDAWVRCVTDPYCAATAVQNYLTRFEQDCNQDGKINCFDYAAIHHLGGYGCSSGAWDKLFDKRFRECITDVNFLS